MLRSETCMRCGILTSVASKHRSSILSGANSILVAAILTLAGAVATGADFGAWLASIGGAAAGWVGRSLTVTTIVLLTLLIGCRPYERGGIVPAGVVVAECPDGTRFPASEGQRMFPFIDACGGSVRYLDANGDLVQSEAWLKEIPTTPSSR